MKEMGTISRRERHRVLWYRQFVSVLVTSALIVAGLAGCGAQSDDAAQNKPADDASTTQSDNGVEPVKIAAFYNMSGVSADAGELSKKGWELAVKQINEAGGIKSLGGAPIEVVIADTMSDTAQSKAVAERVLQDDSILAAIGVGTSATGLPMLPVFEKYGVPFTLNGIGDSFTTQGYSTVFQHVSQGTAWGEAQVEFLKWLNSEKGFNITRVGALYENTENGQSNAEGARNAAAEAGLEWVYDESFNAGLSDAAPVVSKMKQADAQLIFLNGFTQDIKLIMNTMKSMEVFPLIFGAGAAVSFPVFAEEVGDDVEGIIMVGGIPWDNKVVQDDPMIVEAISEFEETNDEFFGETACGSYIGVRIVAAALEAAGTRDREAVKDAMRDVDILSFEGGAIDFDENGKNLNAVPSVSQWQKGEDGRYRLRVIWPEAFSDNEFQVPAALLEN